MRVYRAELKRILKTRSVQILLAAAILLSAVLAYFPSTFPQYVYEDGNGQEVTLTGREAIRMIQEKQGQYQGEITGEKLADALKQYNDFAAGYEGGLPNGVYDERVTTLAVYENVFAIDRLLNSFTYAVTDTGFAFLGDQAIWTPYLMMGAALAEIILFIPLTAVEWCRKRD